VTELLTCEGNRFMPVLGTLADSRHGVPHHAGEGVIGRSTPLA